VAAGHREGKGGDHGDDGPALELSRRVLSAAAREPLYEGSLSAAKTPPVPAGPLSRASSMAISQPELLPLRRSIFTALGRMKSAATAASSPTPVAAPADAEELLRTQQGSTFGRNNHGGGGIGREGTSASMHRVHAVFTATDTEGIPVLSDSDHDTS
jgi:hypothetical protein